MAAPPLKRPKTERWSPRGDTYHNASIPNYVPPELLLFDNGHAIDVFLLRAQLEDAKRLIEHNAADHYFLRCNGEPKSFPPKWSHDGSIRTNTLDVLLTDQRDRLMKTLQERQKKFTAQQLGATGSVAGKEIVKKIYFTDEQFEQKSFGAIFGARGATHQRLQAETQCNIVLGGKGLTDMKKGVNLRKFEDAKAMAEDKPHVRITAPNEAALQKAVEKIEWILSDDIEALRFREEIRKNLAILNGNYNPETWVSLVPEDARAKVQSDDADVNDLLAELGNQ